MSSTNILSLEPSFTSEVFYFRILYSEVRGRGQVGSRGREVGSDGKGLGERGQV